MNFLITGAQMGNKGAQSLLFTLVDQLRKRYGKNIEISFLTLDIHKVQDEALYDFDFIYCEKLYRAIDKSDILHKAILLGKEIIRHQIGKTEFTMCDVMKLKKVLENVNAIIDIGGYSLSSKWNVDINKRVFWYIEAAKKRNIPVILMPQSFGPFQYGKMQDQMDKSIRETLKKADIIFAREKDGYDQLVNQYGLQNVELYPDIVLQSGNIELSNIYCNSTLVEHVALSLPTRKNVGIIPNVMTLAHGNRKHILEIYNLIINNLLKNNYNVYIFRHSNDLSICREIYEGFESNNHVAILENEFNCIEFSEFIKQFDFIIASRFHAIVHSYKENVPALILGWVVKYQELAECFGQEKYVFDITNEQLSNQEGLLNALNIMMQDNFLEKERIRDALEVIQGKTCFDKCWEIIDRRFA